MTQAHTPEPWAVQEFTDDDWPAAIVNTQYWSEDDGEPEQGGEVIAQFISRELAEEFLRRYNACAGINPDAVPELLFSLEGAIREIEHLQKLLGPQAKGGVALAGARAALAKATD